MGKLLAFILIVALAVSVSWTLVTAQNNQNAAPPFKSHCYGTFDGMVSAMNNLKGYSSLHVVTIPSERNYLGIAGSPYCLIWR